MPDHEVALMQQLHDEHAAALWGFCLRLTGHDRARAEDVVQETLLRAWRHRAILDEPAAGACARGCSRSPATSSSTSGAPAAPAASSPSPRCPERGRADDRTDQLLLSWVVAEALTRLSPEHRAVLLECYYRGRPVAEAAARPRGPGGHGQVAHPLRAAGAAAGARGDGGERMSCDVRRTRTAPTSSAPCPRPSAWSSSGTWPSCADCARAVRELAGLPGLLGRVDASVLEDPRRSTTPVPDTLLPAPGRARYDGARRRRTWSPPACCRRRGGRGRGAGRWSLRAARRRAAGRRRRPSTGRAVRRGRGRCCPVGDVPVRATRRARARHVGHPAGPDLHLRPARRRSTSCRAAVTYALVVRTRDGRTEQVGTWRSVDGRTMRLTAATAAEPRATSPQWRCARRQGRAGAAD